MQDTIIREINVKADKERVYKAITDPNEIIAWFPDAIEGTLNVGEQPILNFGEYGKNQIYVEAAKPFDYFAFRWVPGSAHFTGDVLTVPNTLVEFHIEQVGEETKVTVKESGFAMLENEVAEESFKQNSGGWEFMLNRLEKVMSQG